jgi:hypothetical protein
MHLRARLQGDVYRVAACELRVVGAAALSEARARRPKTHARPPPLKHAPSTEILFQVETLSDQYVHTDQGIFRVE